MIALLLTTLLAAPSPAAKHELIAKSRELRLSEQREWRLLLHTEPGGELSDADSPDFFLSPEGKEDPQAELEADIAAFMEPLETVVGEGLTEEALDASPFCTFPARFAFLDARLGLAAAGAPTPSCPAYVKWRATLAPAGISMIFASAFLNAPASMFGHTMLRVDRRDAQGQALLANILNFAAYPTTTNPFAYTVLGLTGGFPGRFSALPYYVKVQEYSNMESRDLWEYPLAFTDEELARLLSHVWELDQTHFDYYFISENCSYHLLSLLEVARPSLHLREDFPLHAIPTDTLKSTLRSVELRAPRVYRASHTRTMNARYKLMTGDEVELARKLVENPEWDPSILQPLAPERRALVLDAAADYHKFETGFTPNQDTEAGRPGKKRELQLARERGKVGADAPPFTVEPPTAEPESEHESMRVGFGSGITNRGRVFGELSWRGSLHDLLDRPNGFVPYSHIEMPNIVLRLRPDRYSDGGGDAEHAIIIDKLALVSITSLTPHSGWVSLPSWRVSFGAERLRDLGNCDDWSCLAGMLNGGIGYTFGSRMLGGEVWYGFFDLNVWGGPKLHPNYRIAPDVALGSAMRVTSFWQSHIEGKLRFDALGDTRAGRWVPIVEVGQNFSLSPNVALRIRGSIWRDSAESALSLYVYY